MTPRTACVAAVAVASLAVACRSNASPSPAAQASPDPPATPAPAPAEASVPADAAPRAAGPTAVEIQQALDEARAFVRPDAPSAASSAVVSNLFVLVARQAGTFFTAAVKLARDALEAFFHDRFTRAPSRLITVYLFPEHASYSAFCKKHFAGTPTETMHCTGRSLAFYHHDSRELLADLGSGTTTLTHEMIHPLLEADFPRAPKWLNEGIASLYEAPVFPRPAEIAGRTDWRTQDLAPVFLDPKRRAATRLRLLFPMSDKAFDADQDLHYALARFVCQWLDERGILWRFYHAWRDGYSDDPMGEGAFRAATQGTVEAEERAWEDWLGAKLKSAKPAAVSP